LSVFRKTRRSEEKGKEDEASLFSQYIPPYSATYNTYAHKQA
jgi:hypothetical protein